ncbi:hypothetical protein [Alicycliphilus denitrificans]
MTHIAPADGPMASGIGAARAFRDAPLPREAGMSISPGMPWVCA